MSQLADVPDEGNDIDDLLALMSDEEAEGGDEEDSFVTCRQNVTLSSTTFTTNNDTFMSAMSTVDDVEESEKATGEEDSDGTTPSPTGFSSDSHDKSHHTLTEEEIQEQLDAAIEKKKEIITKARLLISGSSTAKDNSASASASSGVREVALDFTDSQKKETEKQEVNDRRRLSLDSDSEDEDDEMTDRKDLNSSGRAIKAVLEKKERESLMSMAIPSNSQPSTTSTAPLPSSDRRSSFISGEPSRSTVEKKPPVSAFQPFFGIKIKNPKVSSLAFDAVTEGMKKIRLSTLRPGMEQPENWVTMGVIVERGEPKKSASGHEYMIWRIHDLKNCQDTAVKVLLFGECCKEYWKLQTGATVALVTAQLAEQQKGQPSSGGDKFATLKVSKRAHVMELGYCSTFGICKGVKHDGQQCSNFVNLDLSDFCVYHVMNEARKLSSKRGVFSSISGAPAVKRPLPPRQPQGLVSVSRASLPKQSTALNDAGTVRAAGGVALRPAVGKTTSRTEEKEQLGQIMSSRSHLLGAKNLMRLASSKEDPAPSEKLKTRKHASMAAFMQDRKVEEQKADDDRGPTLGFGLNRHRGEINLAGPVRSKTALNEAAKARAIAVLKKQKDASSSGISKSTKRPNTDAVAGTPSKKQQLGSITNKGDIDSLLKKKSIHDKQADKEESDLAQKYLDGMERKERVETFVTDCKVVKDVKVVTCKKCAYTAQKQSELCMQSGHCVKWHTAEKRFFKCKGCQKRTVAFGLLPNKACVHCDCSDWERVGMKDERKVTLENEKLLLRGDERKHVNT